jgi:hypothetical protein
LRMFADWFPASVWSEAGRIFAMVPVAGRLGVNEMDLVGSEDPRLCVLHAWVRSPVCVVNVGGKTWPREKEPSPREIAGRIVCK